MKRIKLIKYVIGLLVLQVLVSTSIKVDAFNEPDNNKDFQRIFENNQNDDMGYHEIHNGNVFSNDWLYFSYYSLNSKCSIIKLLFNNDLLL